VKRCVMADKSLITGLVALSSRAVTFNLNTIPVYHCPYSLLAPKLFLLNIYIVRNIINQKHELCMKIACKYTCHTTQSTSFGMPRRGKLINSSLSKSLPAQGLQEQLVVADLIKKFPRKTAVRLVHRNAMLKPWRGTHESSSNK
jgi:hypothetical protein